MSTNNQIQGYKIQGNISSIDFNKECNCFAVGGKQSIKIMELKLQNETWFECKKTIGKYKGASITKTCVNELAWNKNGVDLLAIGTTSGYVLVYDIQNSYKNVMQQKGHDGNIKNVVWFPKSRSTFLSSSYENKIMHWDIRTSSNNVKEENSQCCVKTYEYSENTKIRDLKFSPFQDQLLAVQSSAKVEIFDMRKPQKPIFFQEFQDYQKQGNTLQWDPKDSKRLACGIHKEINIFSLNESSQSQELVLEETLSHYSLIKSFKWMSSKNNYFGISGQHPEKNICFYDLKDKNRVAYMYGGHNNRSIDCWLMDQEESILLSVSNTKQKKEGNNRMVNSSGLIVAQYVDNYFDPNQIRFNYPLTFDNNNSLAFAVKIEESLKSSFSENKKKSPNLSPHKSTKYAFPVVYNFQDDIHYRSQHCEHKFANIKEELTFLHKNYLIEGKQEDIIRQNSHICSMVGKQMCGQLWRSLFFLALPAQEQDHTVQSIFEEKLKLDITLVDIHMVLHNKKNHKKHSRRISIEEVLQNIVDHNQLQTAVLAATCLLRKQSNIIDQAFFHRIYAPYIQLLTNMGLYNIVSQTIHLTNSKKFTDGAENNTLFNISCGWCKESVKNKCKCNLICVLSKEKFTDKMIVWCKYCGHGGHLKQYIKWFKEDQKILCPHDCGHRCFTVDDFDEYY